ncbi:MAG TPA: hypothetical protein PLF81_23005 [Candidatus Anammoximicrobium sp.]|nr:hypothetical protein [Candidatus Anammoximicrobium sp.]
MPRLCVFPLVFLFALSHIGLGQDTPPAPRPLPTQATTLAAEKPAAQPPATQPSAGGSAGSKQAGAKEPAAQLPVRQEHVIYVPFKNLREVFEDEDSSIVLPYKQFLEMWNRLVQPDQGPTQPPVNGVITRADYVGAVKGELVELDVTLDVEVLSADWARMPVQFGNAAIGSARSEDGAVLLRGVGEGQYELLVRGQGKHRIQLSLVTGVKSATEGRSFALECPPVGVSNLQLEIPEKDLAVQVHPQRTSELRSDPQGTTGVRAVLGSTNQFTVSWTPKSGSTDQAAGLANVIDTIAVDVGDGVVHTHAVFDYQILRGSLSDLVVEVPADQRLLDVQVPGLRDWQTETAEDRQRVRVRLHAPATGTVRLELHTEAPIAEDAFQVGQVRAVGVARESGILAVRSAEDVGLEYVERESITRIDAADAPSALQRPGSTFYKFFTPDHKLSVVASQLKPRLVVASRLSVLLDKTRLTTRGEFQYQVSRSGVFSLAFRLPAGFQVDDVRTESLERFEVTAADAAQVLTVYFTNQRLGELTVIVTAGQTRDTPAGELALPLIEPLNATREEGLVAVMAPESLEVKTDAAQLQAARAATPADLAAKDFQPQVPEGSTLAAAFSFVTRPVHIVQTISQRPRRTLATVATVATIKEDVVQVATSLQYQIQFAGTDTLRIAVPAPASDRLQIEGEGIKERRKSEPAAGDGTVEWTIVLHSEAIGQRTFTASYDQRLSIPDQGAQWELQPIQALDVDRETGEIAIHKDRVLSVAATATGLEEIDPRELSQPISTAQPHLTYRYYQHPARLTLRVTKHELQDVVKTVVQRAYVEAVVTEDGPLTVRARYEVKSSERQRLAVTLRNPRILGITVAGQTVAPEKAPDVPGGDPADKTYFINVSRTADSDEPFQIAAVFETPRLDKGELEVNGLLRLPLPRFEEGVKFQTTYVRLWVPKEYRLVGDPAGFTSHIRVGMWDSRAMIQAADNPESWFPKDSSSFDFQVAGTTYLFSNLTGSTELAIGYWHIPTMTAIASLIALATGVVLLMFSLETKVFVVLTLAFGVLFAGLFEPSIINSWLLAARLGIAGVIAVWLVVWLLYVRRTGWALPSPGKQAATVPVAVVVDSAAAGASGASQASVDAPVADDRQEKTGKPEGGSDER